VRIEARVAAAKGRARAAAGRIEARVAAAKGRARAAAGRIEARVAAAKGRARAAAGRIGVKRSGKAVNRIPLAVKTSKTAVKMSARAVNTSRLAVRETLLPPSEWQAALAALTGLALKGLQTPSEHSSNRREAHAPKGSLAHLAPFRLPDPVPQVLQERPPRPALLR
jgi:hypothetical protein